MTKSTHTDRKAREVSQAGNSSIKRAIATEVPLALCYNGVAHVVMMVSPDDIEDFILGFSISEGIITQPDDIEEITLSHNEDGIVANIWIKKTLHEKLLTRRRNLVGQTGCGLCGVEALGDVLRKYDAVGAPPSFTVKQIQQALITLDDMQPLHRQTGAVHGAAFMDKNATITHVAEDVGRHNAFDKLIGKLYSSGSEINEGAVILTSRCSFELVQKALAIKLPLLITISAPTELAIQLAEDHQLSLIALARRDSVLIMNDPHHMFAENPAD